MSKKTIEREWNEFVELAPFSPVDIKRQRDENGHVLAFESLAQIELFLKYLDGDVGVALALARAREET